MRTPSHQTRGIAIVIVLAFIVLLTIIVVAFFSRSLLVRQSADASVSQGRADLLAKNAAEIVLTQLQQEIIAGSSQDAARYQANGIWTYMPTAPAAVVPARIGTTDAMPNLVRRSVRSASAQSEEFPGTPYADTTAYPPSTPSKLPKNLASAISTTADARNRPGIALERWNKPMLLGSTLPAAFTAPDWVIVTREGPQAFGTALDPALKDRSLGNPTYALGRYAYTVYDEGSLLDITAAGHPSALSARDKARKGPLPLADLTQIPGVLDADKLVAWRNAATTLTATPSFLDWALDPKINEAFLRVTNGDQTFVGRQDLLAYQQGVGSTVLEPQALQYLTTFSREKNAPSWSPTTPTGSTINYAADADKPASINRNLANVRVKPPVPPLSTPFIRRDGTPAAAGEPLVSRRFPLSKLALVGYSATGDNTSDIYKYFGLTRADDITPWKYDHGQADNILTLDEVATAGREPDFFELLKAAILSGSVGQSGGNTILQTAEIDRKADIHILRIGANIIDQADADSFPTAIEFNGFVDTFGVEDLPYFYRMLDVAFRPDPNGVGKGSAAQLGVWRSFEIWNPHQPQPVGATPLGDPGNPRPEQFRVVAKQGAVTVAAETLKRYPAYSGQDLTKKNQAKAGFYSGDIPPQPAQYYGDTNRFIAKGTPPYDLPSPYPDRTYDPSQDFIPFKIPAGDESTFYRDPGLLNPDVYPGSVDLAEVNPPHKLEQGARIVGISSIGNATGLLDNTPDARLTESRSHPVYTFLNIRPSSTDRVIYELQYLRPGGVTSNPADFLLYQRLPLADDANIRMFDDCGDGSGDAYDSFRSTGNLVSPPPPAQANYRGAGMPRVGLIKIDPRGTRFGASEMYGRLEGNTGLEKFANDKFAPFTFPANEKTSVDGWGAANYPDRKNVGVPASRFLPHSDGGTVWTSNPDPAVPVPQPNDSGEVGFLSVLSDNVDTGMMFYADPDGIVRPGDSWLTSPNAGSTGVDTGFPPTNWSLKTSWSGNNPPPAYHNARPVVLNRPFRSVGELGYVFRDLPWKTLDFFSDKSGDLGLLDVFAIDESEVAAGRVNLNTRHVEILQALLTAALKQEMSTTVNNNTALGAANDEAKELAQEILDKTEPFTNRAELVTFLAGASSLSTHHNKNKIRREAAVRALGGATTTRTWNLMIDVVAQSGRYAANASALSDFLVEGERRYWLHVAIDRFTGEVVDQQLELVYE